MSLRGSGGSRHGLLCSTVDRQVGWRCCSRCAIGLAAAAHCGLFRSIVAGVGDFEAIAGLWRLVATAGGVVAGPAPRVRFWVRPTAGGGGIEVELGAGCHWQGPWRAGRSGLFLAGIAGGSGTVPDRFRDMARGWSWVRDAVAFTRDDGDAAGNGDGDGDGEGLVLWDRHGSLTARLARPPDAAGDESGADHGRRIAGLPGALVPASREWLLGVWRPVLATSYRSGWQDIEFRGDGTWRGFPRGMLVGGSWVAGPGGELLAICPYAIPLGCVPDGGVADWVLEVAHVGFDGDVLVVLDEDGTQLVRLRPVPSPTRAGETGPLWR